MATLERTYTIPLRRGFQKAPAYRRSNRAIATLKDFIVRHMKTTEKNVRIGKHLNELIWTRGARNPPAKVTVTLIKGEDNLVLAELAGKTYTATAKPQAASQEPQGLREKLQAAIGKDEKKEEASAEQPAAEESTEEKAPAKKRVVKKKAVKKAASA